MQHPDDLHMTLVFLGKVSPEQFPCIRKAAASLVAKPFTLELTKTGCWKSPKILWCGSELTPEPLECLVHNLQEGLAGCGFEPEKRVYKPHVTLARKAKSLPRQGLDHTIIWRPREFVLAGSHSGVKPPRYRILDRWTI
jgi:RNA 2',3'-cyclic 3'-phosphodiesterase